MITRHQTLTCLKRVSSVTRSVHSLHKRIQIGQCQEKGVGGEENQKSVYSAEG